MTHRATTFICRIFLLLTLPAWPRWASAIPPLPDFVVESISVGPSNLVEGLPVPIAITVRNQGDAPGDSRFIDLWFNRPTNPAPVFGEVGDWWGPVGILAAGESRVITSPPLPLPRAGTNRICAWIEFENLVTETAPSNNWLCIDYATEPLYTTRQPVHRFWSDQFRAHFYIMGDAERDRIIAKYPGIWNYETVAWYAYPVRAAGTQPVHRFWSDILGKHFYIMGDAERYRIATKYPEIWHYETVAWYAYPSQIAGSDPVGRFWSDQFMGHFYIITQAEIDRIADKYPGIWNYETVAYWAFTAPTNTTVEVEP